jgi:hypothetical protein
LLETEQQLNPLKAADAEIAVKRVIERNRPGKRRATQFGHEPLDDLKESFLDGVRARSLQR